MQYETDKNNKLTGNAELSLKNNTNANLIIEIKDNAYKASTIVKQLNGNAQQTVAIDLSKSVNWYDVSINIKGNNEFERRYEGHVETGKESKSDPAMGNA